MKIKSTGIQRYVRPMQVGRVLGVKENPSQAPVRASFVVSGQVTRS
jgi:hypothetical protein